MSAAIDPPGQFGPTIRLQPQAEFQPWEQRTRLDAGGGGGVENHPFKLVAVPGEAKVTILPGTVNAIMAKIGGVLLDAATPPELTVVSGPVYVEIKYIGAGVSYAEVKNAAVMPVRLSVDMRYIQIGTVALVSGDASVTAQIVFDNLSIAADVLGALVPSLLRPPGYSAAEDAARGWMTWGVVNSVVVSNIASSFALSAGTRIWVKATTNGDVPLVVSAAELGAGATMPADSGGTETSPPDICYRLLGQVSGSPGSYIINPTGSGSLQLSLVPSGYSCVLASAGSAGPPVVPPSPGGVKTNYTIRWDRV